MISVIIPVVNESETVGQLVAAARAHPDVEEVIVVDDGSIDDTPDLARQAGARVLTSTFLGKGASLRDGLQAARGKIVVVADAHLRGLPAEALDRLREPIVAGQADLVVANHAGSLGPINALTARPLLRTFFPELATLNFPLSGLWAARRSLLQKLPCEIDHSVEVGLLLDAAAAAARVHQADTGPLEARQAPPELLAVIAEQVTRTVLARAAEQHRLKASFLAEVQENDRHSQADLVRVLQRPEPADRLALFDMDGVLVRGNFIVELAYQIGKGTELADILDEPDLPECERIPRMAALFAGVPRKTFEEVARDMPLMPGARETVAALRKRGYLVGVVSDGFHVAADVVRCRVLGDFSIANMMKFHRGKAAGRLTFAPALSHPLGCPDHPCCKSNILRHLTRVLGIPTERVLAVANDANDLCLLRAAGLSVAFRPTRSAVRAAADLVIEGALSDLLLSLDNQELTVTK